MKKLTYILLTASLLVAAGCTDEFEELNTDQNQVTAESYVPGYNLSRAQIEYAGNSDFSYDTWRVNIIYLSLMMQHFSSTVGWYNGDKYTQSDAFANATFDVAYNSQVKYVVDLMELTKDDPLNANLYQIARITKVMIFHRLTDLYGEIPYSEAGLGFHGKIFTPVYDSQESIYMDMLNELNEAAQALDASADAPGSVDLMYGDAADQIGQWKKFAYSLMLRLAMRISEVDETEAQNWVQTAVAGGVFTSNADNAAIKHDAAGGRPTVNRNSNILFGEWTALSNQEVVLSKTFVDFMADNNDPRLEVFAKVYGSGSTDPADQIGMPNGYDTNGGEFDISTEPNYPGDMANYSTLRNEIFCALNAPTFVLTYAQVELLLAEAAVKGFGVGGTPEEHYNAGVTAAMEYLAMYNEQGTIASEDIDAYLAANPYSPANGEEMIGEQYWVASFLDWYETWANWRRTDYPQLSPVDYPGNATGGTIPRRMLYPSHESSNNATNYSEAISRQGSNEFNTRVWWDTE
jgi:hypothetical protein